MQPSLHPLLAEELVPVSRDELAAILADAIRDGRGGQMTRLGQTYLAGVCGWFLMERLAEAGVMAVRRPPRTVNLEAGRGAESSY